MRTRERSATERWIRREGASMPLGVSYDPEDQAYNFALYSKHATSVTLLLFAERDLFKPATAERFDPRLNKSGRVWHRRVARAEVIEAPYYAYLIDGPRDRSLGHRFDPAKLLLDPYARAVFFPPEFSREAARKPGSNIGRAPLGVILPPGPEIVRFPDIAPRHTHDAIIYELHVRGFTKRANSGVAADRQGTFAGIIDKIPYLKELGITAVELMPIFQFDPQERNYWGYMPLGFLALHDYASRDAPADRLNEFRSMVQALHEAEIEVILDVVYSHTTEGNETGPCYSFRGIDNTTYYLLENERSRYRNDSGTGNVLHTANRYVAAMVMDSLRYWASEFHVDGFRFDLASLFTRRSDGSVDLEEPPVLGAIQTHSDLAQLRLVAEAWDVASYQLGRSFPATTWLQWNGRFRDDMRSFVRGDPGYVSALMRRLYGSDDLFPDTLQDAYHAFQSVNFVTCHDGFCLRDLVSYNNKRNEANGESNRDGAHDNRSWNCGWEGDEDVPDGVAELRVRQAKNFFALLMLANGTPMFTAGDEFLNTQHGNNNPYNQDNETTWLDWGLLHANAGFFRFCKSMIAFRKAHPSLGRSRFWREDVQWFGTQGPVNLSDEARTLAFLLAGGSEEDRDLYVMINAHDSERRFAVQGQPRPWKRVVDTSLASPEDISDPGEETPLSEPCYVLAARSVVVLLA